MITRNMYKVLKFIILYLLRDPKQNNKEEMYEERETDLPSFRTNEKPKETCN
jgi:hypothetical protein